MFARIGQLAMFVGVIVVIACCITPVATADVTVKQIAKTSGLMGFLDTEMKTTTYLKGDMKCDETEIKMTNSLMKMMGGGKPIKTTSVINLSDKTVLNVDHMRKACTVMDLTEFTAMGNISSGPFDDEEMDDDGEMFDTSRVTMEKPEITVDKTGKKEKIAGYESEQFLINMHVKGTDKESGEEFDFYADMDIWIAQDVPGFEEYNAFNQKLAEQYGMDVSTTIGGSMTDMLAMYGVDGNELSEHAAELEGFPMRTIMKVRGSGGQFDEMLEAGDDEDADETSKAASKMLKGLFGGGGDDDKKDGDKDDGGDKMEFLMTMDTEVQDISTGSVSADMFTCPEKYEDETKK